MSSQKKLDFVTDGIFCYSFFSYFVSSKLAVILYIINGTKYLGWAMGNWEYLSIFRARKIAIFLWFNLIKVWCSLYVTGFNILAFAFTDFHVIFYI